MHMSCALGLCIYFFFFKGGSHFNVVSDRLALNKSPGTKHSAALQNTISSEANKSVEIVRMRNPFAALKQGNGTSHISKKKRFRGRWKKRSRKEHSNESFGNDLRVS